VGARLAVGGCDGAVALGALLSHAHNATLARMSPAAVRVRIIITNVSPLRHDRHERVGAENP
jgi:hypothetical protein